MKSGFVAVVGRANAGKSTLVNVLVGEKVAIVSPKPQTTRDRILGVLTTEKYQIAFIDTPGIYRADNLLNSVMQKTTSDSLVDADLILFVLDGHAGISDTDRELLKKHIRVLHYVHNFLPVQILFLQKLRYHQASLHQYQD